MVLIWISTRAVIVYKHNLYHRIKLCFVIPLRPNGKIQGWNFQDGWTLRVSGLTKFECDARWRFRHYDPFESRSRVALYSQTPYTNCWDIFWFLFSLSVFFNIQNLKYFFHIYFDILRHSSVVARIATHNIFPLHNLNIKQHTGVTHQEIHVFTVFRILWCRLFTPVPTVETVSFPQQDIKSFFCGLCFIQMSTW